MSEGRGLPLPFRSRGVRGDGLSGAIGGWDGRK